MIPAAAVPAAVSAHDGPLPPGAVLAANHQIVSGMGGEPSFTVPAGATEIRLYHPGLASGRDLAAASASVARYLASREHRDHDTVAAQTPTRKVNEHGSGPQP